MCRCRLLCFVSAFILCREKIEIFLKFFLSESLWIGKIMNPATIQGRRIRWVLGWFLIFKVLNVLKVFKVFKGADWASVSESRSFEPCQYRFLRLLARVLRRRTTHG